MIPTVPLFDIPHAGSVRGWTTAFGEPESVAILSVPTTRFGSYEIRRTPTSPSQRLNAGALHATEAEAVAAAADAATRGRVSRKMGYGVGRYTGD